MPKKGSSGNSGTRARSAGSGRFVTKDYAKRNPAKTVEETVKKRSAKK
ncbi:hypothetical protein AB8A21_09590 [Streptomyces sp. BF23-18]